MFEVTLASGLWKDVNTDCGAIQFDEKTSKTKFYKLPAEEAT